MGYNLIEVNHLISFVTSLEMDMEVVVLPDAQAIAERAADAIEAVLVASPTRFWVRPLVLARYRSMTS